MLDLDQDNNFKEYSKTLIIPEQVKITKGTVHRLRRRFEIDNLIIEGCIKIGNYSFINTNIKSCELPNTLVVIGMFAFYDSYLEEIDIPDSVRVIDADCFGYCKKLKKITLPINLEYIGKRAFEYTAIEQIRLPPRFNKIEYDWFKGCYNLNLIEVYDQLEVYSKIILLDLEKYLKEEDFLNQYDDNVTFLMERIMFVEQESDLFHTFGMNIGESPVDRIATREACLINITVDDDDRYTLIWGVVRYQKCFMHSKLSSTFVDPSRISLYSRSWVPLTANELSSLNGQLSSFVNYRISRFISDIKKGQFSWKPANMGTSSFGRYVNYSPYSDDKYYEWSIEEFPVSRTDPKPSWFVFHRIAYPEVSQRHY